VYVGLRTAIRLSVPELSKIKDQYNVM